MPVVLGNPTGTTTKINNEAIQRSDLSYAQTGLLGYLMMLSQEGTPLTREGVQGVKNTGRHATSTAWQALVDKGFLVKIKTESHYYTLGSWYTSPAIFELRVV